MKKFVTLAFFLAGLFIATQVAAQNDTKQDTKKQATESKSTESKSEVQQQPGTITKSGSTSSSKTGESRGQVKQQPGTATKSGTSTKVSVQSSTKSGVSTKPATKPSGADPAVKPVDQTGMAKEDPSAITSRSSAMQGTKVYDAQGNASHTIEKDGTIRDHLGRLMGQYTDKGEYISPTGEKVGYVENGMIRTRDGKEFARISKEGRIYSGDGKYLGTIADDGTVLNVNGVRMGSAPGLDKSVAALIFFFPKQTPLWDSTPPSKK